MALALIAGVCLSALIVAASVATSAGGGHTASYKSGYNTGQQFAVEILKEPPTSSHPIDDLRPGDTSSCAIMWNRIVSGIGAPEDLPDNANQRQFTRGCIDGYNAALDQASN